MPVVSSTNPRFCCLMNQRLELTRKAVCACWTWSREEAQSGTCVLYTTHYMEEAELLCDRIAVMDHGRLIAQGTLTELRAMMGERDLVRLTGAWDTDKVRKALSQLDGVEIVYVGDGSATVSAPNASSRLPSSIRSSLLRGRGCARGDPHAIQSREPVY